jgi:hypothetical protein
MNKTLKFFPLVLLTLTIMPLSVFADASFKSIKNRQNELFNSFKNKANSNMQEIKNKGCAISVQLAASALWNGNNFSAKDEFGEATQRDSLSLKTFKSKLKNLQNNVETNYITNLKCSAAKCTFTCTLDDRTFSDICKQGQTLKSCSPDVFSCLQNVYTKTEYEIHMIQTVCPDGYSEKQSAISSLQNLKNTLGEDNVEYEAEENVLPPEANTNARARANAEYAAQMREPWQEYEAEENVLPAEANTNSSAVAAPYADVNSTVANPNYQAPHEHIDKLSAPTTALAVKDVKAADVKINAPAEPSDKDKKKMLEQKKKSDCENFVNGKYSVGACWCGTTKVTDMTKTCEELKQAKKDSKDQAKIDKAAKDITTKANSLSIGDSLTYETALENELAVAEALSKWESKCEEKTLALAGGAEYDITPTTSGNKTTLTCLIKNCTDAEYNVTTDKKSCTKNANGCADGDTKCSKAATKAESKLEKELEKDINTLSKEFLSVVKSITQTCENGGGSISETGECVVPETTETNGARANGRSAGARSRKR